MQKNYYYDKIMKMKKGLWALAACAAFAFTACTSGEPAPLVNADSVQATSDNYLNNRAPLRQAPFIKLPVGSITPRGWVNRFIELQRDG